MTNNTKPAMEPKKREWKRTTFDFLNGKAWCYRKLIQLDHRLGANSYSELSPRGHYCYNCKNELIFKWKEVESWRDAKPFRFHKVLVKKLEKKEDDWKTLRQTNIYYAFCCKCAKEKHESSEKIVKNKFTKKLMEFDIDKCDCADFIEDKKHEAAQSIKNYESMIDDCEDLIRELENINFKNQEGSFKTRRVNNFIKQLEERRDNASDSQKKERDYLLTYNEWETKRNTQMSLNQKLEISPYEKT